MSWVKAVCGGVLLVSALLAPELRSEEMRPPILEHYVFDLGTSAGYELTFLDPRLGNGTAFFRLELRSRSPRMADVRLEIGRHVAPDAITFALLVSRIQVSFLDRAGRAVQKIDLQGESLWPGGFFVIGDSADGYFQLRRSLRELEGASRVVVRVFGNYE